MRKDFKISKKRGAKENGAQTFKSKRNKKIKGSGTYFAELGVEGFEPVSYCRNRSEVFVKFENNVFSIKFDLRVKERNDGGVGYGVQVVRNRI